jgi:hypothetical protein
MLCGNTGLTQCCHGVVAACRMPCKNTYGAVWEAGIGGVALPTPPLDLRITNGLLQQVSDGRLL